MQQEQGIDQQTNQHSQTELIKDDLERTVEQIKQTEQEKSQLEAQIQEKESEFNAKKKDLEEKDQILQNARQSETLNEFGISTNSNVKIHIIEAKGLTSNDYTGKGDPYIVVNYSDGNVNFQDKTKVVSGQINPE